MRVVPELSRFDDAAEDEDEVLDDDDDDDDSDALDDDDAAVAVAAAPPLQSMSNCATETNFLAVVEAVTWQSMIKAIIIKAMESAF